MKKLFLCFALLFLSGCSMAAVGMSAYTQSKVTMMQEKLIAKERGVVFDIIYSLQQSSGGTQQQRGDTKDIIKVKSIRPQSDAEKAGLQSGDEIILVNGKAPSEIFDLFFNIEDQPITLTIKRKDSQFTTKLMPL